MTTYYCVIPHTTQPRVLLSKREGRWTLPSVRRIEGWLPYAVREIALQLEYEWGLEVTFLRELEDRDINVCEMENHGPQWKIPENACWVSREEMDDLHIEPEALRAVLKSWFEETRTGIAPRLRPDWERRGWLDEAKQWIGEQLNELGSEATGPVTQYKAAWSCSSILRVPTATGNLYFKAGYTKPPGEASVIRALAEKWPHNMPAIVALNEKRRWMLMLDFGGRRLTELPLEHWGQSLQLFAQIQLDTASSLDRWQRLGCRLQNPEQLPADSDRLFSNSDALMLGQVSGCTPDEISALRRQADKIERWCVELAGYSVPLSLVHEDFRERNLRFINKTYLYFDWSDTVITHPFFSAVRFLDFVQLKDVPGSQSLRKLRLYLRDAYLEPWTSYGSLPDLQKAFAVVQKLNPLYLALRWYNESRYMEAASPWGRHNAETLLRKLREFLSSGD
jgi:hypothetical protein